jgi:hypothetical protein
MRDTLLEGGPARGCQLPLPDARAGQHEADHALRLGNRKGLGHRRAKGVTHQHAAIDLHRLQKIVQRLRIVRRLRLLAAQVVTQAVARRIPGDHAPLRRQGRELKPKILGVRAYAVQHHHRWGLRRARLEIRPAIAQEARTRPGRDARQPQGRQWGPLGAVSLAGGAPVGADEAHRIDPLLNLSRSKRNF